MEIEQEELLALLGSKEVEIFILKKQVFALKQAIEKLKPKEVDPQSQG